MPVYASVLPGTSVTASSAEFILHIEVDGVPDTVTCTQLTDTFVVTSGESSKATIPPPTVDHCTDSLEPDEPDAYVNLDTNDKNGNWKLEAPGATVSSAVLSGCKGILAPSGPLLLTGKYDPSDGTLTLKNTLVTIRGSGCTFESPASLSVTITFTPNLGPLPPFAS
ncbi:MAG: hypothetical protein ACLP6E_17985 [Acidimicrobiales bacterium]